MIVKELSNSKLITLIITLFIIDLGHGKLLSALPLFTERLATGVGVTDESIMIPIGIFTIIP